MSGMIAPRSALKDRMPARRAGEADRGNSNMIRNLKRFSVVCAAIALAVFPLKSHAGPVTTLNDLLNGASLQVGDLVFSNFGNFSSLGFLGGKPVDPKLVAVSAT